MRKTAIGVLFCALASVLMMHSSWADGAGEAAAVAVATTWLQQVDSGDYEGSWKSAASFFKSKLTSSGWQSTLTQVRKPLGKVLRRTLKSKTPMTQAPGAPAGQYLVIQYNTDFEKKGGSIEIVTPMLEKDGSWKVSGYFIH